MRRLHPSHGVTSGVRFQESYVMMILDSPVNDPLPALPVVSRGYDEIDAIALLRL